MSSENLVGGRKVAGRVALARSQVLPGSIMPAVLLLGKLVAEPPHDRSQAEPEERGEFFVITTLVEGSIAACS
jgi:hypothetical protein